MRGAAIAILVLFVAGRAMAAEIEAASSVAAVTVYPDGASVTRVLKADLAPGDTTLIARDFPPTLDPASLRVEGEGAARVVIGSIDARPPRPERPPTYPELEKRLEALKDERAAVEDAIAAASLRKRFVERFATSVPLGVGEVADARPLTEWRAAFAAVAEEVAAADAILRAARLKARELDREIARVEADLRGNPARKMEVRIELAAENAGQATFRVTYTVRGARWTPLYDARLDSGQAERKPALEIVRRVEIVQRTGEDWTDVALAVSTLRAATGGEPPELETLTVGIDEDRPRRTAKRKGRAGGGDRQYAPSPMRAPGAPGVAAAPPPTPAREREATLETGGYQVVFRIPGRTSLASNAGAKSLRIGAASLSPDLLVRAAPALDENAYLEASFKHAEEAPLLPGAVALYRDGTFVGRSAMPLTPKGETVRLGFGVDEQVKVARVVVRRTEGSAGVITSLKTDEREYKTTVRNGHEQPIRVRVEDQLPVSETEDVKVELLSATTPPTQRDVRDQRGVLAWVLDLKPGEAREIKFAWRVRWPADKAIVYDPPAP